MYIIIHARGEGDGSGGCARMKRHYRDLPPVEQMPAVFHAWLADLPLYEDKPPNTVRAYSQGVRRLVSYAGIGAGDFGPSAFDQARLTDAVRHMRAGGEVSKATLNQSLAALRSFFDYCLNQRLLDSVPDISRIRRLARLDVPQVDPEYFRPAEIRDLYAAASAEDPDGSRIRWPVRDVAMCAFLAVLGLRASELTAADVGWITRERLDATAGRATWMMQVLGKGRRIRHLPLSPELSDAHGRWQEEREERFGPARPDDPLFLTSDGERFNYRRLRYWLLLLNRRAGLRDRSLHSLRHTAGVQLASDGVPMNVIQSLLGHASITTTGIYTAIAGGELVGVVQRSGANTLLGDLLEEGS